MQTEVAWLKLIGIAMHEKIVIHKNGKNSDKTTKKKCFETSFSKS